MTDGELGGTCEWRLTQIDVADVLGLSVVHTNRTIQILKRMSLVQLDRSRLHVPDLRSLAELANFSPDYLA